VQQPTRPGVYVEGENRNHQLFLRTQRHLATQQIEECDCLLSDFHPVTLDANRRFGGSLGSIKAVPTRDIQVPEFKILAPACDGTCDCYKERQGERDAHYGSGLATAQPLKTHARSVKAKLFGHWLSLKFGMEGFIPRANPIHRLEPANYLVVCFRPFRVVCRFSFPRWSNTARNLQSRCSESRL
jgi:hypothetical protein